MDLSKLLGDLYQSDQSEQTEENDSARDAEEEPSTRFPGPEWADEARLDEAFASWQPGPPDDAPAAEREMVDGYPMTTFPQLEAALSVDARPDDVAGDDVAVDDVAVGPGPDVPMSGEDVTGTALDDEQHDDPVAVPTPMWSRADDEVLPNRRGGRRRLALSLRRR